jgi:Stress responsive A/B Barrel Domain
VTRAVQHVVLLRFPADLGADDAAVIREMVAGWPEQIGLLTRLRFGRDLTGDRTHGYQYLLLTEFESTVDLDAYRVHPVHQKFVAWIHERDVETVAFDYLLDETTSYLPRD